METVEIAFIICHLVTPALGGSPLSSRLSYHPDFISYSFMPTIPALPGMSSGSDQLLLVWV